MSKFQDEKIRKKKKNCKVYKKKIVQGRYMILRIQRLVEIQVAHWVMLWLSKLVVQIQFMVKIEIFQPLALKAPIMTAADDSLEYFFIVFLIK